MEQSPSVEELHVTEPKPEIASWNTPRSREQLLGFIASREEVVFGDMSHDDSDDIFTFAA